MFVNLLINNETNPNFTPLDKLKCLTGMNILNSDLIIEDTEDLLQKYKLLFNNLSVTITHDLIEKFHNNITPEQRNNILENSNKNLKELINLDNSENLTKSDRTVLNLYQNLANIKVETITIHGGDEYSLYKNKS